MFELCYEARAGITRTCLFYSLLKIGYLIFNYYFWAICFSLQFCHLLLHIFWDFLIRCIPVNNCNIFLMGWPFYYYIMSFLSVVTIFVLKSILPDIGSYWSSIWVNIPQNIFSHPFSFNLFMTLNLKWISYRDYIIEGYLFILSIPAF
jgi:hypothetical protein